MWLMLKAPGWGTCFCNWNHKDKGQGRSCSQTETPMSSMSVCQSCSAVPCKGALKAHLNAAGVQRKVQHLTCLICNLEEKMDVVITFSGVFKCNCDVT